jgi:hypothetical protein
MREIPARRAEPFQRRGRLYRRISDNTYRRRFQAASAGGAIGVREPRTARSLVTKDGAIRRQPDEAQSITPDGGFGLIEGEAEEVTNGVARIGANNGA